MWALCVGVVRHVRVHGCRTRRSRATRCNRPPNTGCTRSRSIMMPSRLPSPREPLLQVRLFSTHMCPGLQPLRVCDLLVGERAVGPVRRKGPFGRRRQRQVVNPAMTDRAVPSPHAPSVAPRGTARRTSTRADDHSIAELGFPTNDRQYHRRCASCDFSCSGGLHLGNRPRVSPVQFLAQLSRRPSRRESAGPMSSMSALPLVRWRCRTI